MLTQMRTHLINRLHGAGTAPTPMQAQLLLVHAQAYHLAHFGQAAFPERVIKTQEGITIHELRDYDNGKGMPMGAIDTSRNPYSSSPPAPISESCVAAAEAVLKAHGWKSGWALQVELTETAAWNNTPIGERGSPNSLDISALARELYPDVVPASAAPGPNWAGFSR